jgi:hypothetical protein
MAGNAQHPSSERRLSSSGMSNRMRRLSSSRTETAETSDVTQKKLAEMGYEQELKRSLSMISILGLSFAIIAVPFVRSQMYALTEGVVDDILYWFD